MEKLVEKRCVPCEGGVPPLQGKELKRYKKKLGQEAPGWKLVGAKHLTKTYKFSDFLSALRFVNQIGEIAERESHHPNISFGWGFVTITIWTHAINGLSENDFILASKIEALRTTKFLAS